MRGPRFTVGAFRFLGIERDHMHSRPKRRGQMIPRGDRKWLLRVFLGRDADGRNRYASKTVTATTAQAQQELTKLLRESDTKSLARPTKYTLAEYVEHAAEGLGADWGREHLAEAVALGLAAESQVQTDCRDEK